MSCENVWHGNKLLPCFFLVLCSFALPISSRLEGEQQQEHLTEDVPCWPVGERHVSEGPSSERQWYYHMQAGPDLEPHELCV